MKHQDHVNLLQAGIPRGGGLWADFGCGDGAFTLALAELLGPQGIIHAVDRDQGALNTLQQTLPEAYPLITLHTYHADYTRPLDLPPLDGLLAANTLHFQADKDAAVQQWLTYLRPGGRFLVVEYNTDRGNHWVPSPFSFATWQQIATRNGLEATTLLATHPSRFLGEFYSAVSVVPVP